MKFVLMTFAMIHLSGRRDFELSAVDTLVWGGGGGGLLFLFLYSSFPVSSNLLGTHCTTCSYMPEKPYKTFRKPQNFSISVAPLKQNIKIWLVAQNFSTALNQSNIMKITAIYALHCVTI